jgi:large subunit ribosomal protein L23
MKTVPMKEERLLQVILAPVISEKGDDVGGQEREQVIFRVATTATKPEIKAAVELLFKVQVKAVNRVANVKGKNKRFGRFNGRSFRAGRRHLFVSSLDKNLTFAAGE